MYGERARKKEEAAQELEKGCAGVCVWHVSLWSCFVGVAPRGSERCLALTASPNPLGPAGRLDIQQQHFKTLLTQQLCNN